jgi:hypothetical protein
MKSPILGLALSTVAFGASTVYFWIQLHAVQAQAEAMDAANARLTTRVAELQRRREQVAAHRFAALAGSVPHESRVYQPGPQSGSGPGPSGAAQVWTVTNGDGAEAPPMPEAMLKMVRANVRAQTKRMYFDLQSKLGLTDAQTSDLLDLLADEHTVGFKGPRNHDPERAREYWETEQAKRKAAIDNVLGSAKAVAFEEYQKSMPVRSELMTIAQQLDGVETPLTDSQRSRMLDALVAERERIPMPSFTQGTSPEDSTKAYDDWQTDYEKRIADAARGILTSEQLNTFNQYQQWQHEMRQQLASHVVGSGPAAHVDATFVTDGPPGSYAVTIENAPSSPPEKP